MPPDFQALKRIVGEVHRAFGCGPDSRLGIHLDVQREGERIVSGYTATIRDEGPPGIVHGGVQGILVDAMAGWATAEVQARRGEPTLRFPVTVEMDLRFLRPLPTGIPLGLAAWPEDAGKRRVTTRVTLSAEASVRTEARVVYHLLDRPWFDNPYVP